MVPNSYQPSSTLVPPTPTAPTNKTIAGGGSVTFDNLYPAILQCFVVILAGYAAGRFGHVSSTQSRGIATFVSHFCLPAMLFRAMCTLDFSQVNWNFLLAILIAKLTVFVVVGVITLLVKRSHGLGHAGLFGIFATQSNDFALGYPMLQALYQNFHPEYLNYLYLIAPISLLILNPVGFALMEIHRHFNPHDPTSLPENQNPGQPASGRRRQRYDSARSTGSVNPAEGVGGEMRERTCRQGVVQVVKGVFCNPIVFMTAIGLLGNLALSHSVPILLDNILALLGQAFSGSALFYLGLSMVGKVKSQVGINLVVPVLLIFAKSLLLPLVTWEVVSWLQTNETSGTDLSMYGFLYGTFPTAPSVIIFAHQYNIAQETVTTGLVAGTFLSAPLMFVSAKMMTVVVNSMLDYHSLLMNTSFDVSIAGIVCSLWVLGVLVLSGRWRRVPHRFTVCLLLSQLLGCIGMVSYYVVSSSSGGWAHYVQFITLLVGVFSSRCWTAALAIALCLLHTRSLCSVLKAQVWLGFLGFGFPVMMTGLLFLLGAQHISDEIDPSFHYGFIQTLFSAIVLTVSLLITLVSMVVWQRNMRYTAESGYTPITTTPSRDAERGGGDGEGRVERESTLGSPVYNSYQACAPTLLPTCESIEDIIPFPTDQKSVRSDSSCEEDHGMVRSGAIPIDERTCLLGRCTTEERLACRQRLRRYASAQESGVDSPQDEESMEPVQALKEEYQSTHHLLLLLLLSISMFVGLFLCLWKIFNNAVSGIYVEIEFLDSFFNYGQSFFLVMVFGFDTRLVFSPIMRRYVSRHKWLYLVYVRVRRWMYGAELVRLPEPWQLDEDTQTTCHRFVTFHLQTCRALICRDGRFRLRRYQKVFTGKELCDWLMGAGLVEDKVEAVRYGRQLLLGRVIAHVTGVHHFQCSTFFYTFVDTDNVDC
ncbi:hypothetical protein ACOMHN_008127 [Nucella lapillus]